MGVSVVIDESCIEVGGLTGGRIPWGGVLAWRIESMTSYDRKAKKEVEIGKMLTIDYGMESRGFLHISSTDVAPATMQQAIDALRRHAQDREGVAAPPVIPLQQSSRKPKTPEEEFFDAAIYGQTERIRELLQADPGLVRATDLRGMTVLHVIGQEDNPKLADLLISAGADVHAADGMGATPLFIASKKLVPVLVKHGANVNARAHDGSTPLHAWACESDDTGAVGSIKALLKAGADPTLADHNGKTPADHAEERDDKKKMKLLKPS